MEAGQLAGICNPGMFRLQHKYSNFYAAGHEGRNGKFIEAISAAADEEEVLFRSGSRFKVSAIDELEVNGEKAYEIRMIEVD